ncbi:type IX secretion/gliding motility protein PorT/SprT [Pseudotenacibaculum haliotis]|uniref:Porin family protein n=1 Tax=Pseudotenacibaculum haliotis TaxID=1862138 RepID=A0ABW5LT47_9FLAO
MKKAFLILIAFLFVIPASAQLFQKRDRRNVDNLPIFDKRRLHYGFYLGLNQNDFKINYRPSNFPNATVEVKPTAGFNVGLIADLRLHKNINLRFEPGLISNSKTLYFNNNSALLNAQDSVREIGSTYLHLPLVLKFSTDRWNNVRPYVLAGVSYDHNFSSNQDNSDDNFSGEFRMKTTNFMYEIGIGIDIYLYYFKLSPSIRGVFAMNRELVDDNGANSPWTSPINAFSTRGIFLNFAFE